MIRKEDVADLREGDVVELRDDRWPEGTVIRGPVANPSAGVLTLGPVTLNHSGWAADFPHCWSLTVVSRAPRPLYVNSSRTEPVPGDVVRDADKEQARVVWLCDSSGDWWTPTDGTVRMWERQYMPARLRLLVDGTTGQVVPS